MPRRLRVYAARTNEYVSESHCPLANLFPIPKNALSDYDGYPFMNAHQIYTTRSRWVRHQSMVSARQELATSPPIIAIRPHGYVSSGSGMELNATSTTQSPPTLDRPSFGPLRLHFAPAVRCRNSMETQITDGVGGPPPATSEQQFLSSLDGRL